MTEVFNISKDTYPLLFQLKRNKRQDMIKKIFDIGYNYLFKTETESIGYEDDIRVKLSTLENTMSKLIGISSSSMKKGEFAENMLEQMVNERYGDIKYTDMAQVDHCGDAWLKFDSFDDIVILESKNYTSKVNKEEVEKLHNDMITNNIKWAIFVSWNSSIQGYKDFDISTFNNNSDVYTIIYLGNFINNTEILDIAIMIIRKLITNYSDTKKFPWITSKITDELNELNKIIDLNYQLREYYLDMEKNIKQSMDKFYLSMREYQHSIDEKVNYIIKEISGTMTESISINTIDNSSLLAIYNGNKKMFALLTKLLDIMKTHCIEINDEMGVYKNNIHIGDIKFMNKKIILKVNKYNMSIEFTHDLDNFDIFNLI